MFDHVTIRVSDRPSPTSRPNGEPAERPEYHAGCYAAYILDPDGNNIELVDHDR